MSGTISHYAFCCNDDMEYSSDSDDSEITSTDMLRQFNRQVDAIATKHNVGVFGVNPLPCGGQWIRIEDRFRKIVLLKDYGGSPIILTGDRSKLVTTGFKIAILVYAYPVSLVTKVNTYRSCIMYRFEAPYGADGTRICDARYTLARVTTSEWHDTISAAWYDLCDKLPGKRMYATAYAAFKSALFSDTIQKRLQNVHGSVIRTKQNVTSSNRVQDNQFCVVCL